MLLGDVNRRGTTIVLATHDREVMAHGARERWRRINLVAGKVDAPAAEIDDVIGQIDEDGAPRVVPLTASGGASA